MTTINADCDDPTTARVTAVLTELGGAAGGARIGTLRGDRVTYWSQASATGAAGTLSTTSEPAHSTALGQVLLAHAPDSVRIRVLTHELGPHHAAAPDVREQVRSALSVAWLTGVAVARRQSPSRELGVAVPVLDDDGQLLAGLEVTAVDFDQVESVLPDLLAASRRICSAG